MAEIASGDERSTEMTGLQGDSRTSLVTLTARAWDAKSPAPILGDNRAASIHAMLLKDGYDMRTTDMPPFECQSVTIRTKQFDRWVSAFLSKHSNALVLHLACGLDTRVERIEWKTGQRWFDVDLPEVIALRKKYYNADFHGRGYCLLDADVTDDTWLDELPTDQPTAVVMEGLLSYLTEEQSLRLISRLSKHFLRGEIYFDCVCSTVLNATRKGQAKAIRDIKANLKSSIDDLDQFANDVGGGVEVLEVVRFVEMDGVQFLPMTARLQLYILSWIPRLRDSARFVRMGFNSSQ